MSESIELQIEYPNGDTAMTLVSIVEADGDRLSRPASAANIYRLEETPVFVDPDLELYVRDIIETEPQADGTCRALQRHCHTRCEPGNLGPAAITHPSTVIVPTDLASCAGTGTLGVWASDAAQSIFQY